MEQHNQHEISLFFFSSQTPVLRGKRRASDKKNSWTNRCGCIHSERLFCVWIRFIATAAETIRGKKHEPLYISAGRKFPIVLQLKTMNKPVCPLWSTATMWMQLEVLLKIYSKLYTFLSLLLSYPRSSSLHIANSPAHHLFLSGCDFAGGAGAEQRRNFRSRPGCSR